MSCLPHPLSTTRPPPSTPNLHTDTCVCVCVCVCAAPSCPGPSCHQQTSQKEEASLVGCLVRSHEASETHVQPTQASLCARARTHTHTHTHTVLQTGPVHNKLAQCTGWPARLASPGWDFMCAAALARLPSAPSRMHMTDDCCVCVDCCVRVCGLLCVCGPLHVSPSWWGQEGSPMQTHLSNGLKQRANWSSWTTVARAPFAGSGLWSGSRAASQSSVPEQRPTRPLSSPRS